MKKTNLTDRSESDNSFDDDGAVYSARFTFAPGEYDDEFHHLNELIDQAAEKNPGFLEKESWISPDETKTSVVYYWSSMEALKAFSKHPDHIEAKRRYQEWYDGYEVVVAKVLSRRGDDRLE
jgi:heme-degrading monooxygenase HmoA